MAASRASVCKDMAAVSAIPLLLIVFGIGHLHLKVQGVRELYELERLARVRLGELTQEFNLLKARRDALRETTPAAAESLKNCQTELLAVSQQILQLKRQMERSGGDVVLADSNQYRRR